MKDEEMAEEYLQEKLEERKNKFVFELPKVYITDIPQAFLAGLKAGRPQWHDLQKDKNDLPKFRRNILVTCEYRSKLKKKRETFVWDYNSEMPLHAIAWCEIPTFDKE